MKVLVLYSEIAGYFISCIRQFIQDYGGEVHVVRWPIDSDAPFQFGPEPGLFYYERREYDTAGLLTLAGRIDPDLVYIAGWIDMPYLKVASRYYRMGRPVICAFDRQWFGTWRQRLATLLSPFFLLRRFSHAWVPGLFQYEYARRLGFPRGRILTGMYSGDLNSFNQAFRDASEAKDGHFPHRFLYVGRFLELKGVRELYIAFEELSRETNHNWELLLVGGGPLKSELPETANIRFRDFVQPDALPGLAREAGVFVLPSRKDAWGVVLHEFAAAGLPLISSDQAGAITAFVREGYNGYIHKGSDAQSLKAALKRVIAHSDEELREMGKRSEELSRQISPATWAAQLKAIADNY